MNNPKAPTPIVSSALLDDSKRECPHCHGSLTQYEDPAAVKIIGGLEADLYERLQWLNNAERILRDLGYERCTATACNCSSYHRRESSNAPGERPGGWTANRDKQKYESETRRSKTNPRKRPIRHEANRRRTPK